MESVAILSAAIETATRKAFAELADRCGGEQLYAFALYSDEDAITLCPSANTLEHLEAGGDKDDWAYYQFEPAEWKYEMEGAEKEFNQISAQLRHAAQKTVGTEKRSRQLRELAVSVLAKLKEEGFFNSLAKREVFLTWSVSDSDMDPEIIEPIIRLLNGPFYAQQYIDWMKTWD
ncbi:DUF4303 domain-containing protein [Pseudoflavitalea sp. G-6-1-2]|uniref:DUF4303 domain-containing protein n=1 Tax=Pseudoflavitalea sp. G-6-1-2 TaxID=2728841 RepID=UPI00146B598C|nr:DUF4303 domain-containing protein [Pseudoflavitalea sp. G-6-1-2]NML22353.1 DUF4303 domain-containing protein [Pseudoflavitalea sp. G-6-1-2]